MVMYQVPGIAAVLTKTAVVPEYMGMHIRYTSYSGHKNTGTRYL